MLVEVLKEPTLEVRKVSGEWSRAQPLTMRIELSAILRAPSELPVIIDLKDLGLLGDWGALVIAQALEWSKAKAMVASVDTYDALKHHLALGGVEVPCFEDLESAKASLQ